MIKSLLNTSSVLLAICSFPAFAELDPELAAASPKEVTGFFMGPKFGLGLAAPTESGSSGFAVSAGGGLGVNLSQGMWGVWQIGAELELGQARFRTGEGDITQKNELSNATFGLRAGYGQKMGSDIFNLFSIGVGPSMANYKATIDEVTATSPDMLSGYALGLAYDLVYRASEHFNLGFGYHIDHYSYDVDKLKTDGQSYSVGRTLNYNTHTLQVKMSLHI